MLVLPVFAGCIFVLPYLSAKLFGESVLSGLLVFLGCSCIYAACIYGIGEKCAPFRFVTAAGGGGIPGKFLLVIQILRLLLRIAFYIVLSIEILGEAQVPYMSGKNLDNPADFLVVLPLLLVAVYGAVQGSASSKNVSSLSRRKEYNLGTPEKQGRIHEMIFWVLFIPFIIMILFGLKEVDYSVFIPHLQMPFTRFVFYGYMLVTFILPVEYYLYVRPELAKQRIMVKDRKEDADQEKKTFLYQKKSSVWKSYIAIFSVILLAIVISLLILGIYGVRGAGNEEMVTIAIMRYIRLPFGVLERFDVLIVWFFMAGCFILLCGALYYTGYLLQVLCAGIKRIWLLLGALAVASGIAVLLPGYSDTLLMAGYYGAIIDIPLSILIPLLGMGVSELSSEREEKGDQA